MVLCFMRNIYSGIKFGTKYKGVCAKCGAEWEISIYKIGKPCGAVHGSIPCSGIVQKKLK